MNFSENLKRIRNEKGFSQKEIAAKLGVSQPSYAQYENGKRNPKAETIKKIAAALDVDVSELSEMSKEIVILKGLDGVSMRPPNKQYSDKVFNSILQDMLINEFNLLNDIGKGVAITQVEMLTKIPEYKKEGT